LGGVLGCSMYFNRVLLDVGLPYVFECTGDSGLSSPGDFLALASESTSLLSELLGLKFNVEGLEHWEYIGRRFNLYAFNISHKGVSIGQVRVVESGGLLVNISGVLSDYTSNLVDAGVLEDLKSGRRLSLGYNIGLTLLDRVEREWPQGQKAIPSYVIYAAEGIPDVDVELWSLRVRGPGGDLNLKLDDIEAEALELEERDFHCVTGWSVKGNRWVGVRLRDIASKVGAVNAKWVLAKSIGGYTTIAPASEALAEDSIVAVGLNSKKLTKEAGAPARLVIPRLYGWKSAKWLKEIEFLEEYIDGYWEALAYHERGLVEAEERFKIRNPRIAEERRLPEKTKQIKPWGF
jgi:DMSO/TMAO reductase YedYZ molybdopterin-dependent catalytic subunit